MCTEGEGDANTEELSLMELLVLAQPVPVYVLDQPWYMFSPSECLDILGDWGGLRC